VGDYGNTDVVLISPQKVAAEATQQHHRFHLASYLEDVSVVFAVMFNG